MTILLAISMVPSGSPRSVCAFMASPIAWPRSKSTVMISSMNGLAAITALLAWLIFWKNSNIMLILLHLEYIGVIRELIEYRLGNRAESVGGSRFSLLGSV